MRRLCHIVLVVVLTGFAASILASGVACSSGPKAYIPVDNALRTWQPPEGDAYTPDPAPVPSAAAPAAGKVDKPPAAAPAKEKKADKRP